jgi:hypothetical protein
MGEEIFLNDSGWSNTFACASRHVHHGLSLIFTFTDYYICSGLTHKTMSVLHVFLVEEVCSYRFMIIAVFWVSNEGRPY